MHSYFNGLIMLHDYSINRKHSKYIINLQIMDNKHLASQSISFGHIRTHGSTHTRVCPACWRTLSTRTEATCRGIDIKIVESMACIRLLRGNPIHKIRCYIPVPPCADYEPVYCSLLRVGRNYPFRIQLQGIQDYGIICGRRLQPCVVRSFMNEPVQGHCAGNDAPFWS